jgi:serine/threonine protein kinase
LGESPVETLRKVIHEQPLSPRQLNPAVSRNLEQICLKCLDKNPKDRYASAADLADDLRRFVAGEPVLARPLPAFTRLYRWSDRNIGKFTAIAIAVVLLMPLVTFLGFGFLFERWPWPLLLFSYPLMLVLSSPYILMMLLTNSRARAKRMAGDPTAFYPASSTSMPLVVLGSVLIASAVIGYGCVLLKFGWAVPQEARYLAIVAVLGIGAIIRGLSN